VVRKGTKEQQDEHCGDAHENATLPFAPSTDDSSLATQSTAVVKSVCVDCATKIGALDDAGGATEDWETRSTFHMAARRVRGSTVFETIRRAFALYAPEHCLGTRLPLPCEKGNNGTDAPPALALTGNVVSSPGGGSGGSVTSFLTRRRRNDPSP